MKDDDIWKAYTRGVTPIKRRAIEPPGKAPRPVVLPRGDRYLDLHGMTLNEAWQAVKDHVLDTALDGRKKTLVVTGFSGAIRREFPRWLEAMPRVREATPTHGDGAFVLRLHKRGRGR